MTILIHHMMDFKALILLFMFGSFIACKTKHYHLEETTVNVCYEHRMDNDTIHEHDTMKIEKVKLIKK